MLSSPGHGAPEAGILKNAISLQLPKCSLGFALVRL